MTTAMLQCFISVCHKQSITKTAESLFISKQAVSANIRNMEQELGISLFQRTHGKLMLTPAGHRLLFHAESIIRQWEICLTELSSFTHIDSQIRIGMGYRAKTLWTPELAHFFHLRNPDIVFSVKGGFALDLLHAMDQGELDCVITFMREELKGKFNAIPLCNSPLTFFMKDTDPLTQKALISINDLNGRVLIMHKSGESFLNQIALWLKGKGIHVQTACFPSGDFIAEAALIQKYDGISIRNKVFYASEPETFGYSTIPADDTDFCDAPPYEITLFTPKDTIPSLEVVTFISFFRKQLQLIV